MPVAPFKLKRRVAATVALALLAALLSFVALPSQPAAAGNVWIVRTANSPSTGEPIRGGGTWIVNKPSGYYLGRLLPGWAFENVQTTPANWHFGRAVSRLNMCGWAMPGSMDAYSSTVPDSCSEATKDRIVHRTEIGRDFNAPAHVAGDGTAVPANQGCLLHYNYFYGTDFGSNGGRWADPAGPPSATVMYRFTTRDGQAVVVRDPALGWGFLPVGCVQRPGALYNDDDVP